MSKNIQYTAALASYSLTNAYAIVTGLSLTCLKTGHYRIKSEFTFLGAASADNCYFYLAINTNKKSRAQSALTGGTAGATRFPCSCSVDYVYLKKNEVVSLYAKYTDSGGSIEYSSGDIEPFLTIVEI